MKTRIAAALAVLGLVLLAGGRPASAHGATTDPLSRTAACASGGERTGSAVCRAAAKANGGPFGSYDNLRVAGVDGRDRQRVPDGKLCSGGVAGFAGLDLVRADWPVTRLRPGAALSLSYRTTIPHRGTFRVYLTEPGYRADRPLSWDELPAKPFITAVDPPLRDGAYRFAGRLPADRTGRHVLYVVWQNSSTPDTYYSCSDVVFPAAAPAPVPAPAPAAKKAAPARKKVAAAPVKSAGPVVSAASPRPAPGLTVVNAEQPADTGRYVLIAALLLLMVVTGAWAALRIRRRH